MANIKTKDTKKGTIKTIDKALIATQKIKQSYVATKEKAENVAKTDGNSPEEYASNRVENGIDKAVHDGYICLTKPVEKDLKTQKSIIIKQKTAFIVSNNREQNSHLESRLLKIRILQLQLLKNRRKK